MNSRTWRKVIVRFRRKRILLGRNIMNTTFIEGQQTTNSMIALDNNAAGSAAYTGDEIDE